ncbi:FMN-dependent NADH-azoreductase [Streptomyces sp. NPDC086766]|uniref:FMN-dependent NADH-azoreductase n=1 Tax=Streptomyces sp. NPDC086766 TaxID=3365754 RepID=UPI0037F28FEB
MATLLHLDSALYPEGSASRDVTAAFRREWESQHPDGTVIYRDLAAEPLPHLDLRGAIAGFSDPAVHTPEQAAAYALRDQLATELEQADALLIGAPMYNLTISSTLKAWLEQALIMGRTGGDNPSAAGTPAVVVASRGGSYAPGTPRDGLDFVVPYLEKVLTVGMGLEVEFIVPELTLAHADPAMAHLVDLAEASRTKALEDSVAKAKALAARFA